MSWPSSIPGDGTSDPFTMQDPRPTPSSRENSHVHHIHEFGEVDRIVHVAPSETSITDDHDPVVPASADQSPSAKIKREKRVWNRLFHDRHLMQYFYQGTLYRTVGKRKVGTEELFFDLVIVAAVAALGHELRISEITWQSTEKFILLFSAVYNSWRQSVLLWNLWGIQEDLLEKAGLYVTFFALSGIALGGHNAFDDLARPFVAVSAFVASAIPALAGVAWSFSESLMKNPANRVNQLILSDIFTFVSIVPYLIAACVRDENLTRNLYWVAFGLQLAALLIPHQLYRHLHRRIDDYTRIALNIELVVEKYEVLTMIVLGETMIGLLFEGGTAILQEGVRVGYMYLSAMFSTAMLYSLQTLYVQVDGPIQKGGTHAIRHSTWAGFGWGLLHTPYHLFLILFATGLNLNFRDIAVPPTAEVARNLVRAGAESASKIPGAPHFTTNAQWLFCVGWGGSLISSALIGAFHKAGPRAATKGIRLVLRCAVAIGFMVGLPLSDFSATWFQATTAMVTVSMAFTEFVLVQMDRIGYFRSERFLARVEKDESQKLDGVEAATDSQSSHSGANECVEQGIHAPQPQGDIESGKQESGKSKDLIALEKRLSQNHKKRLVPVYPKKQQKRTNHGEGLG